MKKILILLALICVPLVSADTNVSLDVISNDIINIWANPNTDGSTNYYLDGIKYEKEESDKNQDLKSINKAFYRFWGENPKLVEFEDISNGYAQRFRWIMENYFVPRSEMRSVIQAQQQQIQELQIQLKVHEQLFTEEQLCQARMSVAEKEGFDKIECQSIIWHYDSRIQNWVNVGGI